MKERGLLLTPLLYEAALRGDKTQTRRVMKPQPEWPDYFSGTIIPYPGVVGPDNKPYHSPYGYSFDRLYVKEQLAKDQLGMVCYRRGMERVLRPANEVEREAGWAEVTTWWKDCGWTRDWLSPLHMPKWAARLWLEITRVRVERVQDISEDDAKAEGVDYNPQAPAAFTHRGAFAKLWDSINAKRGEYEVQELWVPDTEGDLPGGEYDFSWDGGEWRQMRYWPEWYDKNTDDWVRPCVGDDPEGWMMDASDPKSTRIRLSDGSVLGVVLAKKRTRRLDRSYSWESNPWVWCIDWDVAT